MNEINEIGSDDPNKDDRVVFSKENKDQTILLLGSGALKIGEAGEFDYSGSQAIKAFKEEGYRVVLINPNIATNQTSWGLADAVYFVPVIPSFVERVIEKENPDTIALSFGGQTALNCGLALNDSGVLEKYNIKVLGTPVESIRKTEDRALFNKELQSIGIPVPMSRACNTLEESLKAAELITYPVIIRGAFALGGKGSGRAMNEKELKELAKNAFVESPQILVEEDLTGWKEIEYEVVRDKVDNCITVCNMENVDPLGIHTGESIVIAPSQTLDNEDYQMLRSAALKVIRHMGIIGECNIQYALDPKSRNYRVIEVNARLSRSSALASKATGYPLAFVAAKLGLGYTMPALQNAITKITCADFEPSLDYVAVKVPRWDLQKFRFVSNLVTSEMKSVGEVMALGKTFEEALNKALRMLNIGTQGLFPATFNFPDITNELKRPTPRRIFAVAEALRGEWTPEEISIATGMDMWFLERIAECAACANDLSKTKEITPELLNRAKKDGFSDTAIGKLTETPTEEVRQNRIKNNIVPVIQQIDTLAGEFPTETNYLYMTYHGYKQDINLEGNSNSNKSAIVLGGGPYSIGSSVEFDWCCVQTVHELQKQNYSVTMINSNPETVSTDYDECDTLFFEELSEERVRDIIDYVNPDGVVVSMGGQIPNSLARKLAHHGINILGTDPKNIDCAEDRNKFSSMLDNLEVDQPEWEEFCELDSAISFSEQVGYPVIVRPSYVLSGASMAVVHSKADLEAYIGQSSFINKESPIVISKFEQGAKEIEFDGVAQNGKLLIYAISEHVENAGVHSGDATMVLPPQRVNLETMRMVKRISRNIAGALDISGPFNIQFLAARNKLKVIECNLRASRSFPFASKVTGENFITIATQALLGIADYSKKYQTIDIDHVGVKAAQFSFSRLKGADPRLGIEMASTGEVACFGHNAEQALLKALIAVGFKTPKKNILLTIGSLEDKVDMLPSIQMLKEKGFSFFATKNTHNFLESRGVTSAMLNKISEPRSPNIKEYLEKRRIDLVINIPTHSSGNEQTDGYFIRRIATDQGIPLITNVQLAKRIIEALYQEDIESLPLLRWPDLLQD
ncbi:carbamoyl-phosphate synthase (glutamine-hydrolyzing) large subunit [Candidatus Peregrinibacteria bacterium]|jgi:carbamoyl-phosphate synthase large subunit|nr:carbamoyl-phosphate synthase (glutamine-hydrolyzing) large subunit [Candidatus Peregrinibacteria bacterium]MBT3598460.1 carbamoyl-phosphate synthase (glutamine-hydrolyzing) large subunit [Candidatus Peregrinibacteria bacterium]MBT4367121.1 carbamoyl-phosphate synthase (glutamine-hydrolyzing) large subunit [Candidatus Peregrinibacteria bacterium]MBT4585990.1 carbamoyl-phosphate synthase (glutamine-hydrolyzing) large subunit [Candidatus Peregrinibacteria bacterium]MBT6730871.1 carbamoyl-phosph